MTPDSGQGTRSFYSVSWPFIDAADWEGLVVRMACLRVNPIPPVTLLSVSSTETLAHFFLLLTIQKHVPSNLLNERKQK